MVEPKSIEENAEWIKLNLNGIKDATYKQNDIFQKMEEHLKHINWNLGTIAGALTKNKKLLAEIDKAKKEDSAAKPKID